MVERDDLEHFLNFPLKIFNDLAFVSIVSPITGVHVNSIHVLSNALLIILYLMAPAWVIRASYVVPPFAEMPRWHANVPFVIIEIRSRALISSMQIQQGFARDTKFLIE